jgi:hypothetical protein
VIHIIVPVIVIRKSPSLHTSLIDAGDLCARGALRRFIPERHHEEDADRGYARLLGDRRNY